MYKVGEYLVCGFVLVVVSVFGGYLYVVASTCPFVYSTIKSAPTAQVALVLGASVKQDGTLSPVLKNRADAAVSLYKEGKVSKILVTGDNGELSHNEVNPTGKYLLAQGVPKSDIFLDHAGFDTYSSLYRAKEVFNVESVIVVSQEFHLPRALFIAQGLDIGAFGFKTSSGGLYVYNWLREVPATWKSLWDTHVGRMPKYLGDRIDISADGSSTWADDMVAI